MTTHWWLITRDTTNQCTYRYVNLLHYEQCSLLQVSATYCGHLQGGVVAGCITQIQKGLPKGGHNGWPKHAAGYAVQNTIYWHICISRYSLFLFLRWWIAFFCRYAGRSFESTQSNSRNSDRTISVRQIISRHQCNTVLYIYISCHQSNTVLYTGCNRRKGQNFGRVFLMLKYTDITQNTYIQSWTVTEIMARKVWNFDSCYTLID